MTYKILLVEDSPTQALEYASAIKNAGFEVEIAEDGITAMTMLNRKPDGIVLDVNLPGMNGFQVCRRIRRDEETQHLPVIMLTSSDTTSDTLEGLDAGANDYIPKDEYGIENLISTLQSLFAVEEGEI